MRRHMIGEANNSIFPRVLQKYLYGMIGKLDRGLTINPAESGVARVRPDFTAIDVNENPVLIECNGTGRERDVTQVREYGRDLQLRKKRRRSVRGSWFTSS